MSLRTESQKTLQMHAGVSLLLQVPASLID